MSCADRGGKKNKMISNRSFFSRHQNLQWLWRYRDWRQWTAFKANFFQRLRGRLWQLYLCCHQQAWQRKHKHRTVWWVFKVAFFGILLCACKLIKKKQFDVYNIFFNCNTDIWCWTAMSNIIALSLIIHPIMLKKAVKFQYIYLSSLCHNLLSYFATLQ